jgi:hypothetical protein
MTRDTIKTLAFLALAVVMTGAAFLNIPDRSRKDAEFVELGSKFFPDFTDPNSCASLEVVDYDASTARPLPFKVQLKDGKWTIPSHYDYPADGKDRLIKTATGVIDLTKDTIRSYRFEDQEELGVVDPTDTTTASLKGKGKRVTLKDASDKVLADFIIGKEVKDRPGQRYVRIPGEKRTYGVNMKVDLSTKFADWIETNLLKVDVAKVRKVDFDGHKVDPDQGRLIPGEILKIERKDASAPWNLVGATVPPGKDLDTEKLLALVTALGDVKIVGVRPKPEGLTRDLKATGDVKVQSRTTLNSLVARGFYPTKDGVVSNEGDVIVRTEDGAVYTLRFGGVFVGSGDALSAGIEEPKPSTDPAKKAEKKPDDTESRYLLVTVAFDPTLLPPMPDPDAGKPLDLPADVFHHEPGTPERIAQDKLAKDKADKRKADEAKRIADAEKKVKDLSDRFAAWYYLTPNDAFRSIALNRETLIHEKSARPPEGPEGAGGFPGLPGGFPGMGGPGGARGGRPFNPHGPN